MHKTVSKIRLTCTGDPISSVARVASAGVTPLCVSALCILVTVVWVITPTFIDIYMKKQHTLKHISSADQRQFKSYHCSLFHFHLAGSLTHIIIYIQLTVLLKLQVHLKCAIIKNTMQVLANLCS